jgi:hypothetical protein
MRHFAGFALLLLTACIRGSSATQPDPETGAYTLDSVDGDTLPTQPEYSTRSRWVLSGSLTLQPNGYFVLLERDSVWTGLTFVREEWAAGGQWMVDGSMLTLTDTSADQMDAYGGTSATYLGSIAPSGVLLRLATDDGSEDHMYRYTR